MKVKKNFLKERFIKIPSRTEYYSSCEGACGSNCGDNCAADGGDKRRKKLKRRRSFESRCYFRIPYLRISPNPLSIAFLLLVVFSNDLWPHTMLFVAGSPLNLRHSHHRHRHESQVQSGPTLSETSKSELPLFYPFNNSIVSFNSSVNTLSQASVAPLNVFSDKKNRHFNTLSTDLHSGEMFLKSSSQFLRKRYGRSSRSYRISSSSLPPRDLRSRKLSSSPFSYFSDSRPPVTSTSISSLSSSSKVPSSSMPPCSHVGDATNEISARAYIADTVFEGKVRSKSTIKDAFGRYGVTFVVQHVYKDQSNGQSLLRPKTQVRLFFVEKSTSASNVTKPIVLCVQKYNYLKRQGDLTKANIARGRRYIVFVNRIGPHNYTIIGEPVPQSKKNMQAVKEVLCRNCVKQIKVWGLKNESVTLGAELKLVCRIQGTPLPALQWFKDGAPIIVTSRLRIQYKKRRSLLVIPEVRNSDSGKYECRGLGVQSISPVSSSSVVSINARFDNITALWPLEGKPCPMHLVYCMNGGTCTYYETIGEFTCQCADGFNGGRCENKDVGNSNSTYESITCFDGVTSSYPCVTVWTDTFKEMTNEYRSPTFQAKLNILLQTSVAVTTAKT